MRAVALRTRMAPHIVMKGNLKLLMDRLPRRAAKGRGGRGEPEAGEPEIPGSRSTPKRAGFPRDGWIGRNGHEAGSTTSDHARTILQ